MKAITKLFGIAALLGAHAAMAGHPVNVNTASAEELAAALDGVGLSRAAAIVDYRTQNGPFQASDDLRNVKGIGESTLEKNRANILVSDGQSTPIAAQ